MQTATETQPTKRGRGRGRANSGSAWKLNCEHELGAEYKAGRKSEGRRAVRKVEIEGEIVSKSERERERELE